MAQGRLSRRARRRPAEDWETRRARLATRAQPGDPGAAHASGGGPADSHVRMMRDGELVRTHTVTAFGASTWIGGFPLADRNEPRNRSEYTGTRRFYAGAPGAGEGWTLPAAGESSQRS